MLDFLTSRHLSSPHIRTVLDSCWTPTNREGACFRYVSTLGPVDFRPGKERTATYAKAMKRQAKLNKKLNSSPSATSGP
ncbi:hypothetical protein [Streptomyces iranensis]|uniref:hypothetical protein n=1 Tax=Streptomyces iranensis TaxID=576784 RepID=UPI000B185209